jgi:hypothetical protein
MVIFLVLSTFILVFNDLFMKTDTIIITTLYCTCNLITSLVWALIMLKVARKQTKPQNEPETQNLTMHSQEHTSYISEQSQLIISHETTAFDYPGTEFKAIKYEEVV